LFAVADLLCPWTTWGTFVVAVVIGVAVGALCHRLDLERLGTGVLALVVFFPLQWIGRGGLTAQHLFLFFVFANFAACLGYLREERETN
jgi:hypothetical protein